MKEKYKNPIITMSRRSWNHWDMKTLNEWEEESTSCLNQVQIHRTAKIIKRWEKHPSIEIL